MLQQARLAALTVLRCDGFLLVFLHAQTKREQTMNHATLRVQLYSPLSVLFKATKARSNRFFSNGLSNCLRASSLSAPKYNNASTEVTLSWRSGSCNAFAR